MLFVVEYPWGLWRILDELKKKDVNWLIFDVWVKIAKIVCKHGQHGFNVVLKKKRWNHLPGHWHLMRLSPLPKCHLWWYAAVRFWLAPHLGSWKPSKESWSKALFGHSWLVASVSWEILCYTLVLWCWPK